MAANVIINERNGAAPGAKTDKTAGTVRFKSADNALVDLNNPLIVPSSGQEYSFEKWLRLEIAGGAFTQISNLRAYTDGANSFGVGVKAWYAVTGAYMPPVAPDKTLTPPRSVAAGSPVEPMADLFTATAASPIDLDGINIGPFTDGSPTEDIGDFLVLVMEVAPTASNGVLATETLTFAYDEI